jgi:hypothetical protein
VWIPLACGLNALVLSVEGVTVGGETARDTQRFLFRVE